MFLYFFHVENLWAILKRRLRNKDTLTRASLIRHIREAWALISVDYCRSLARSMPHRIAACIANKGMVKYSLTPKQNYL